MLDQKIPPKRIRKIKIITPYCLRKFFIQKNFSGKKLNKIHEPSSGGTGIKLNTASHILIDTIYESAIAIAGFAKNTDIGVNLIIKPKTIATDRFEMGPAEETFNSPYFLSLKL